MRKAIKGLVGSLLGVILVVSSITLGASPAQALNGSDFDPGFIISDERFFAAESMNEPQVQAFMVSQVPICRSTNGVPCLRGFTETTPSRPASPGGQCNGYAGAASEPASRIIVKVAQSCGINPQVLLVTLQKERGLITKTNPIAADFTIALGYGCPDTGPCDPTQYRFATQVYKAAWQFKEYTINPQSWRYRIGNIPIQYHPNAACGASTVRVRNQATANLYNYTPYQPNAAALGNLSGVGDVCSSYGNRNFWVHFSNWFGSPTGPVSPRGVVESMTVQPGGVRVTGWAFDPDANDPTGVHVYASGTGKAGIADGNRPDVNAAFGGGLGDFHGYDITVPAVIGGPQSICVYGINQGLGTNTLIECRSADVASGAPIGAVESVTTGIGTVTVSGWTFDPDTADSVPVHVYSDGAGTASIANSPRPDIAAAFPLYGAAHGYSVTMPSATGARNVCVYGINAGPGTNVNLGCSRVNVPAAAGTIPELGRSPIGVLESVTATVGSVSVSGWALDPDTSASMRVHVYVGSSGVNLAADSPRDDVAAAHPGYGPNHGFGASIAASPGANTVCAYAINEGPGPHTQLGCRQVTVPAPPGSPSTALPELGRAPFGMLESVSTIAGAVAVSGWAIDPDTIASLRVHVYVDAAGVSLLANFPRNDVAAAYPAYGPNHAFGATIAATPGARTVCAYAINEGPGVHTLLGCRQVVVP